MDTDGSLRKLQNGSDVRGVALATEGGLPVNLTEAAVNRIAQAFVVWLAQRTNKTPQSLTIGVGHDSRLTAQTLKEEIIQGITAAGAVCMDCGLASTPAMFMGTVFDATCFDGSIMITASHLPKDRNGMKFFTKDGGLDKPDITAVLEKAEGMSAVEASAQASACDLMQTYAAYLRDKIVLGAQAGEVPLSGLHIVVDAGNGAGGFYVSKVLEPLGADCSGSQYLDPDGNFPNHQPNPENKEAMEALRSAVLLNKANLGIIFDTDVDRMSAVLPDGREVNRDAIIAMMAAILAPEYPGSTIVTDSVTSDRLTYFLQDSLGLRHHRFKRGYKNVINEAIRLNREGIVTPLAIETSGHGALKENYFLDDGAYLAVKIVAAAAKARNARKPLESLLQGLADPGVEMERRIPIQGEDFGEYGRQVLDTFVIRAKQEGIQQADSFEGIRLSFPQKGWLLLRLSLHEPLLPLNLEGVTKEDAQYILDVAKRLLDGFDRLDLTVLS